MLVLFEGCHLGTIPPGAITPSAMVETQVRIGLYYKQNAKLPATLDVLPVRKNYLNRTVDVWGRPLQYTVDPDGTFTLVSLGKDGVTGGAGDDSDTIKKYRVVDRRVDEVPRSATP